MSSDSGYRDRIVEVVQIKARDIGASSFNWRKHGEGQRRALDDVLRTVGKAGVLLAYRDGDDRLRLVDGHLRRDMDPDSMWWVAITDLNETEARRLNATFDPIAALAETDQAALAALASSELHAFSDEGLIGAVAALAGIDAASVMSGGSTGDARSDGVTDPTSDTTGDVEQERRDFKAEGAKRAAEQAERRAAAARRFGVKYGQVWAVGDHRVACGDSTDARLTALLFGGELADVVFADPPYNIAENAHMDISLRPNSYGELYDSEWDREFEVEPFADALLARCADDCTIYICSAQYTFNEIQDWMKVRLDFGRFCVWCKTTSMPSMSKRRFLHATEFVNYGVRGKPTFHYGAEGGHDFNWHTAPAAGGGSRIHPTQKPVPVVEHYVKHSSNKGDRLYDPCFGSGTSIVAGNNLGLRVFGVERNPTYFADALRRFADDEGFDVRLVDALEVEQ